jgi:hypothetical protein
MGFNLDDYEPVAARLARFLEKYPNGAIHTEIVFDDGVRVVIKATVWRDMADPMPAAIDYAEELLTDRGVNSTSRVENASTSATGRGLSLIGFLGSDWTKKPSREEMSKVVRAGGGGGGTAPSGSGTYATPKQIAYIRRLGADRGHTSEEALQAAVDAALGTEVLVSQLSPGQASRVIEAWK